MKQKEYLINIIIAFIIFVGILFYSYIFKLGFLNKATFLFLTLCIFTSIINIFNRSSFKGFLFWSFITLSFIYGLIDKVLKLHIRLAEFIENYFIFNSVIIINILYVIIFIAVLLFFYKYLMKEFKKDPVWIYLFTFAIGLQIISIISDIVFNDITEDYFGLFSLYFFTASFLSAYIKTKKQYENSNLSSKY